jgi:hypothetical protein
MPAISAIEDAFIDCIGVSGLQKVIRISGVTNSIIYIVLSTIWAAGLALVADPVRFVNSWV